MAALSEEQVILRRSARDWAQKESPVGAFRKLRDSGAALCFDPAIWHEMSQMGWPGVVIPEDFGGSDFGYLSMGLIFEEIGRTLTASPLLSSAVAAASALMLGGSQTQKHEWLPKIAAGSGIATLAVDEGMRYCPDFVALKVERTASGYSLNGEKSFVLDGLAADLFIVSGRVAGSPGEREGIELFLVDAEASGVERRRLLLADSRGVANLRFTNVAVGKEAVLTGGYDLLEKTLDRACACLCAEMLGMANQAFDTTLEYLKTRVQFGQVIGSFQALQHRAAAMFTDLELTRSAVEAALMAIDDDATDVSLQVSAAKVKAGDALHLISNEMIQMHGGIGMTDAHDAGFYLKRARAAEASFGNQSLHRDRFARLKGF